MRNIIKKKDTKNNKKLLGIALLSILALFAGILALSFGGSSVHAYAAEIEHYDDCEHEHLVKQATFSNVNGRNVLDQAYLSVHYADGTMGMVLDETYDPNTIPIESRSFTHLQRSTVRSSGKPDNQSIVAVFLGDGFTKGEQQTFLDRVTEAANYMITVAPLDLYKDYLTVYAVHSISNQSGVSGEVDGVFACRNSEGNPATPQCTPVDSSVFNCMHGRDTFYHSYYQWRSSAGRVILEMDSADRTRARNHAFAACSSANMVQIIANSAMRGGTGQMPTSIQPLGVALTSINHAAPSGDWKEVIMHEFGHTFGGLWDEYWNGLTPAEYPNMTRASSTTIVKWSHWVGKQNVSVYPFAASERDGNPNQATNPWFRPHQNCIMRQTSNPFCAVCCEELMRRMALTTGVTAYTTTPLTGDTIRIDSFNLAYTGSLTLPEFLNGRTVTEIGDAAFKDQSQLTDVYIPSTITKIGFEAFSPNTALSGYGGNRADIDLVVVEGTTDAFIANGWTGFNIVELSGSGALTVVSGKLRGDVNIPATFNNRAVTEIGSSGFAGQDLITNIMMLSVTTIGSKAFNGCDNLVGAFYMSGVAADVVPDHSTSYTNYYYTEQPLDMSLIAGVVYTLSFRYSDLTASTDISNVFTSLGVGENTFAVDLPVQKAFTSASGTQEITFTATADQLSKSDKLWCRFIRTSTPQTVSINISNVSIKIGVIEMKSDSFSSCDKLASPGLSYRLLDNDTYAVEGFDNSWQSGLLLFNRTLFIPSYYNGKQVTQIDSRAFANQDYLKWVFIQSEISEIGDRAFQFCYALESLDLSATAVNRIEDYTFDSCKFKSFTFPKKLEYVGEGAFIRTGLLGNLPDSVTTIGDYAFAYRTGMLFVYLPKNLSSIGTYAFAYNDQIRLSNSETALKIIGAYAFYNTNFLSTNIDSFIDKAISIGDYAFANSDLNEMLISNTLAFVGSNAFYGNDELTIYTEFASKPVGWSNTWNSYNSPVFWGCSLSTYKTYVVSFVKSASNPSNTDVTSELQNPYRSGYNFSGWYTTADFSGTQYTDVTTAPDGTLYAKWTEQSCIAEGTLITLADGSQVAVEDLTGNESLLVWNMFTGAFDVAPILFIDSDPYAEYEIIHLYFSDGTEVKVISEHAFWDFDLNKYIFLRNDAAQYIGHRFNKQADDGNGNIIWTAVQLVDVDVYMEYTTAWSPVTFGHLCYYVNAMLSMPGATEGLINIFAVDAYTMQYNASSLAADIATYGLFTYEEFAAIFPIPEAIFEAFNGQYLKISIGKGLTDMESVIALLEEYNGYFSE